MTKDSTTKPIQLEDIVQISATEMPEPQVRVLYKIFRADEYGQSLYEGEDDRFRTGVYDRYDFVKLVDRGRDGLTLWSKDGRTFEKPGYTGLEVTLIKPADPPKEEEEERPKKERGYGDYVRVVERGSDGVTTLLVPFRIIEKNIDPGFFGSKYFVTLQGYVGEGGDGPIMTSRVSPEDYFSYWILNKYIKLRMYTAGPDQRYYSERWAAERDADMIRRHNKHNPDHQVRS